MNRWLATAVFALLAAGAAAAADFAVSPGAPNKVEFLSKAPMESFTGKSTAVSGSVRLDPAALEAGVEATLEVDMATFRTGSGLRDRHMRENHLHTDKYPKAVFTASKFAGLSANALEAGHAVTGKIFGTMELHGVRKDVEAEVELELENGALHVVARFPVTLADYEIPRPQMLMMKLGETQQVTVDLTASAP